MKQGLFLLSSMGLGAGLMYLFDPAHGRRRRARARSRLRVAGHQMGDRLDETTQTMRDWTSRAAAGWPSWPGHIPAPRRMLALSHGWHDRQRRIDWGLLLLGCLGLGTVGLGLIGARPAARQATAQGVTKALGNVYDWTRGVVAGVGAWFQPENGSKKAPATQAQIQ